MRARPNDPMRPTAGPPWQVMAVFDPEGTGSDFAYTVGLAEFGQPELHMWARPTHGEDPGHDFKFSSLDLASILGHFAERLLTADLAVGDCEEIAFDEGMNHALIMSLVRKCPS